MLTLTSLLLASALAGPIGASESELLEVEDRAREIAGLATRATVGLQVGPNLGSGVIVSAEGHVLTAGHVIEGPGRRVKVTLSDGRVVSGVTLGVNRWIDSGMVRITEEGDWPFLEMGRASELEAGDWVLALGHPGGVEKDRPPVVRLGRVRSHDPRVIRSDCTIVSGDSGGPLVDLSGRVVGIHTSLRRFLIANDHLPVDTFRRTWDLLVGSTAWGGGAIGRSFLGVSCRPDGSRCRVRAVEEGLAADKAGLLPGDIVVSIDGTPIDDGFAELEQLVSERPVGEALAFAIERDGERLDLDIVIERHGGSDAVRIVDTPWSSLGTTKFERSMLSDFRNAARRARAATVEVLCDGERVALGTVVDAAGLVVTKASELVGPVIVRVDGDDYEARLRATDENYDVALLEVDATLVSAPFDDRALDPGQWVITPGSRSVPISAGIVSTPIRRIPTRFGYLGVVLGDGRTGPRIREVIANSGAEKAGLMAGDMILGIDGTEVGDSRAITEVVRAIRPDSAVTIAYRRGGEEHKVEATLGVHPYEEGGPVAAQDRDSGPLSRVRSGFPRAIQHDSVLRPNECGGPLIDVSGSVVGVNLARAGRAASYAVPTAELLAVVAELRDLELR